MTIMDLTETFDVRRLTEEDIPSVLSVMKGNPFYFETCPPEADENTVRLDMAALPAGTRPEQKYYLGIFQKNLLICVIDLITDYPQNQTVWIGFFMVEASQQHKGIGSSLVQKILSVFEEAGYQKFQLGCMERNLPAVMFWEKNGFVLTGESREGKHGVFRIMERAGENV